MEFKFNALTLVYQYLTICISISIANNFTVNVMIYKRILHSTYYQNITL